MAGRPMESFDECVAWFASGARDRASFRVGTEHECLAIDAEGRLLPYEGPVSIRALLEGMAERHGWQPIYESGRPIALRKDDASITLEPAGQFELSGAPLRTITETHREVERHMNALRGVGRGLGVRYVHLGMNPITALEDVPHMPKARYDHMRAWMPKVGAFGLQMMHLTCTVQANLDFADEREAMDMLRLGMLATPAMIALFANSPWRFGRSTGMASVRAHIWTDVDRARCDLGPMGFDPTATVADYACWLADVPLYFVKSRDADGREVYLPGDGVMRFSDFLAHGAHGRRPTLDDWELHVSTVFPDIRLKRYIEVRGADCVPPALLSALPALCRGLLNEPGARAEGLRLLRDGDPRLDRAALRAAACRHGLSGQSQGIRLKKWSQRLIAIAREGTRRLEAEMGADPEAHQALDRLEALARGDVEPLHARAAWRLAAEPTLLAVSGEGDWETERQAAWRPGAA